MLTDAAYLIIIGCGVFFRSGYEKALKRQGFFDAEAVDVERKYTAVAYEIKYAADIKSPGVVFAVLESDISLFDEAAVFKGVEQIFSSRGAFAVKADKVFVIIYKACLMVVKSG